MSKQVRSLLDNAKLAMKDGCHDIAGNLISQALRFEPKNVKAASLMTKWRKAAPKKSWRNFIFIPWTLSVLFWKEIPPWLQSWLQEISYRFFR